MRQPADDPATRGRFQESRAKPTTRYTKLQTQRSLGSISSDAVPPSAEGIAAGLRGSEARRS